MRELGDGVGKEHGCAHPVPAPNSMEKLPQELSCRAVSLGEEGNTASRTQRLKQEEAQDECGGPGVWLLWVCCGREECEQFLGRISPQDISIRKGLAEQG